MVAIQSHALISSKLYLLFSLSFLPWLTAHNSNLVSNRLGIGIGIGIGIGNGGSSNPPPPPTFQCPPPPIRPAPALPPQPKPKPLNPPPPPPKRGLTAADFPNLLLYESYKVIQRFKKTITYDPFKKTKSWEGADLRKYEGFFLEATPRFKNNTPVIASVDFNGFHLGAPSIFGFIDKFPDLGLFHANSNFLKGTVPDLTHLPYLYEIDLSNNKFSGDFPTTVLPLFNLSFLDLRFNLFTSVLPPATFFLPLQYLFLNNNGFSQPLPSSLGSTTANYLTLANNAFTGPIPPSIALANRTLIEVLFLGNKLSGCLPPEIGRLQKATVFDAGFNEITGPIPQSFGCLTRVEQLNLAGNFLYGEVPEEVCNLGIGGRLLNLSLSRNYFTSLGDSCRSLLSCGVLDIRRNCIPGCADQRPKAECIRFLAHQKQCPLVSYKWTEDGSPAAEDAPARRGYSGYSALGRRIGL